MIDLRHGDCLQLMGDIPSGSVDMILCDLPYGTTACKWDVVIPFAPLWEHYKRVIKRNGAIVLFGSQPFTTDLISSNRAWFRYTWIWHKNKPTGFYNARRQPQGGHEDIAVFYQAQPTYNPQMVRRTPEEYKACMRKNDSLSHLGEHFGKGRPIWLRRKPVDEQWYKHPTTMLTVKKDDRRNGKQHPTQKPVALGEYLIRTYTNEGETVLDNCMGSGSFGVSAVNTNRSFIGIEKDAGYFQIAQERIQAAQNAARQLPLAV